MLLVAPAGMGKTTVAQAAATAAGVTVARGAAVHFLESHRYLGLTRALHRPPPNGAPSTVAAAVHDRLEGDTLFLDDLHWADADTIDLLPALVAHGRLILATRPGEGRAARVLDALDPVLADVEVIVLEPLSDLSALELVDHRRPGLPIGLARGIVDGADGNPLLLELAALGRDGAAGNSVSALVLSCSLPARHTLALLGLHHPDVGPTSPGVDELVTRGMVRLDGQTVRLAGDVLGELALEDLDPPVRRALHVERALASTDPGEAALHWRAGGDLEAAQRSATDGAAAASEPLARARLLSIAAELTVPPQQWEVTRRACQAWLHLGRLDEVERLIAMAEAAAPCPIDAYDWELMRAQILIGHRRAAEALDVVDAAFARFAEMPDDYRCWLTGLRAAAGAFALDLDGALADAAEAIRIGERAGVSTAPAELIAATIHMYLATPGWEADLTGVFDRTFVDDPRVAHEAGAGLALGAYLSHDRERGAATCERLIDLAAQEENVGWDRRARAIHACHEARLRPDHALSGPLGGLLDDPSAGASRSMIGATLAVALIDAGDLDGARRRIDREARRRPDNPEILWARSELGWATSDFELCASAAQKALETGSLVNLGNPEAAVLLCWAAVELGRPVEDVPMPLAVLPAMHGLVLEAEALGSLAGGDHAEAAAGFAAARVLHEPYLRRESVRCAWAEADAWARAGEAEQAEAALVEARRQAADLGSSSFDARIDRVARHLGLGRPGDGGPKSAVVTPRQREVLLFVRQGLTTQSIAARLHLTPATVESHVRSAMVRTGSRSRLEASLAIED